MANTPKEPPKSFIDALNEQESTKKQEQDKEAQLHAINKAGIKNVEATNRTTEAVTKGAADIKAGVKITNPDLAKTGDVASAVDAIHKLNLTTFNTNQGLPQLADNLVKLTQAVQTLQKDYESKGVAGLSKQLAALVDKLDGVSKVLNNSKVEVDSGLQKTIDDLQKSINAIEFNPTVNVKAPAAKVVTTPVDLSSVEAGLKAVVESIEKQEAPETDLGPVVSGLADVQNAITSLRFPVPNYVLPFKDVNGEAVQVQLDSNGNLPTSATISASGLATSANQTNGNQKTQLVDGAGNVIGATTNALDVNIKSGSSSGTQYAELATTAPGTGTLAVGRYKATPPSLTDGQLYGLQLDTSGNLKVTGSLSVGGTTDNSAFTAGTSTGTPSMGFYHSVIDTVTDGRAAALAITSKRALLVNLQNASGTEIGTSSNPVQVTLANTGANATAVKVDGSAVTQPVSGTITANIGTTNGLALDSSVNGILLAQGSTTSGQTGPLVQTATTTAAPTYTTAKTNPLSTTTSGALRVDLGATSANATAIKVDGSAVTQPVSGTFWQATQPVSGTVTANQGGTWLMDETARSVSSQTNLTTTATVSSAAGRFAGGSFINLNSAPAYLQVFDTTGAVTLGTTAPTFVQPIPSNATAANGAAFVFNIHPGITIANGIKVAATTTPTGATTVATGLTGYVMYR